ncbi:MAG TPA: TlpA disulfide reductase family protein [Verrucomicrobiae bacterium]|nr:TlpA disulfide reductase family protein [Verrucomicrobiae bacterium]
MNTYLHKFKRPCACVLAAIFIAAAIGANAALKVGDTLPDFSNYKLEGKLPELKGKVVLVDFWASWCGPCAQSFPVMDELQKKYQEQGFVIVAVNVDEKAANMETFLKKNPVSFSVIRDAEQKLVAAISPETMPTSFIIDRTGKVRFLHNGFYGAATRKEYIEQIESLLKESQ